MDPASYGQGSQSLGRQIFPREETATFLTTVNFWVTMRVDLDVGGVDAVTQVFRLALWLVLRKRCDLSSMDKNRLQCSLTLEGFFLVKCLATHVIYGLSSRCTIIFHWAIVGHQLCIADNPLCFHLLVLVINRLPVPKRAKIGD